MPPPSADRVVLRRAQDRDADALAQIAAGAYAKYLPRLPEGVRPAPMDADYAAAVASAEVWVAEVWVAEVRVAEVRVPEKAWAPIGFAVLVPSTDHLLLENVAVRPEAQGRGIGRRLLALAEERARALGLPRITLYTHVVMQENQELYRRLGYTETGRRREDGLSRVFYEKPV